MIQSITELIILENGTIICYHKHINGRVLPDFDTFANVAATICDNFNCEMPKLGTSVLGEITK